MQVRNVTSEDLSEALDKTNEGFEGNVQFRRCEHAGMTRQGTDKFTVTLTVFDSSAPGSRRSPTGRKIASACWHVYGTFMDALPEVAKIVSAYPTRHISSPGDTWVDWPIRAGGYHIYMSDACECQ